MIKTTIMKAMIANAEAMKGTRSMRVSSYLAKQHLSNEFHPPATKRKDLRDGRGLVTRFAQGCLELFLLHIRKINARV
jgi:hypothetical protein